MTDHCVTHAWHPQSWQGAPNPQAIQYADTASLQGVCDTLAQAEPIANIETINALLATMAQLQAGNGLLLQAGHCAERFADCAVEPIQAQVALIGMLQQQLAASSGSAVTTIGRIAGQFTKPRSQLHETVAGQVMPAYRGDAVNLESPNLQARQPDVKRLLMAYDAAKQATAVLPESLYTSHEALHLPYEAALTRAVNQQHYCCSTHFPWVGLRTIGRTAPVEYLRGISNPIGLKLDASIQPAALVELVQWLNPLNIAGRITLIHRFGYQAIQTLPNYLRAIEAAKLPVGWLCDPMHGNSQIVPESGIKTRDIEHICSEVQQSRQLHRQYGSHLVGLHLEVTHQAVTECIGGDITIDKLKENYQSALDPRLNPEQAKQVITCFTAA